MHRYGALNGQHELSPHVSAPGHGLTGWLLHAAAHAITRGSVDAHRTTLGTETAIPSGYAAPGDEGIQGRSGVVRGSGGPTIFCMKIAAGTVVKLEYELRIKGGDVLESSEKTGPLQYVHGQGRLLPALEKRLEGLAAGDERSGDIPASEVVPPADQLPTRVVPRKELAGQELKVGQMFEAHTAEGAGVKLEVVKIDDEKVTMRLVPPLAGKDLAYKVKVIRIEDPATHQVSMLRKPPPPIPAEAIHLEVEPDGE